jgi:hypothetical protein
MSRRDRRQHRRRTRSARVAATKVPLPEQTGPLELFRAGRRREVTVRCLQVLVLLMAPVALWGAYDTAFDGPDILDQRGEAVSWAVRYATAAFLFVVGAGGAIGIIVYGWCYVTHAVWDEEAGRCRLTLLGFFVPVQVDMPPAGKPRYLRSDGFAHARGIVVHAPYYSIRIPGRRLPVIVDEQGEFPHGDLFHRVFLGSGQLEIMTARAARRRTAT